LWLTELAIEGALFVRARIGAIVGSTAAVVCVGPRATVQEVVAAVSDEPVVTVVTLQVVISIASLESVISSATEHPKVPVISGDEICATVAEDAVAAEPIKKVIASATDDRVGFMVVRVVLDAIGLRVAYKRVIKERAEDRFDATEVVSSLTSSHAG
jgi:hypothetical protein